MFIAYFVRSRKESLRKAKEMNGIATTRPGVWKTGAKEEEIVMDEDKAVQDNIQEKLKHK